VIITEFGECFDWVELWNEPNNLSEYDWTLDPEWHDFQRDDRRGGVLGPATRQAHRARGDVAGGPELAAADGLARRPAVHRQCSTSRRRSPSPPASTTRCDDFAVNARGTLNLLEAIRGLDEPPPLVFTSTNKVYGALAGRRAAAAARATSRSTARSAARHRRGPPLDFHSPYGCSKGAADQYVLDYARTFGLPAVVFRMSCIYGPHQFGTEDQGWVAHFLIRALEGGRSRSTATASRCATSSSSTTWSRRSCWPASTCRRSRARPSTSAAGPEHRQPAGRAGPDRADAPRGTGARGAFDVRLWRTSGGDQRYYGTIWANDRCRENPSAAP
jgi:hypothetical protein